MTDVSIHPKDLAAARAVEDTMYFVESYNVLAERVHATCVEKGFWPRNLADRNDGEAIALMHEELSEALWALRHGNPADEKLPAFTNLEVELADAIIRIMDYGKGRGLRVAEALVAKMAYNATRPYKHGREF